MSKDNIFNKVFTEALMSQVRKEADELKLHMDELRSLGIENPLSIVSVLGKHVKENLTNIDAKKLMKYSIELARKGMSEKDIIEELETINR